MSNQSPSTNSQNEISSNSASEVKDWREMRREERANRHAERRAMRSSSAYGWTGGLILIVIGGVVLLQNLTGIRLFNWWALFIFNSCGRSICFCLEHLSKEWQVDEQWARLFDRRFCFSDHRSRVFV